MKRQFFLILIGAALAANAQNWSAPVAVTTGAGDDHHVDIAYDWYENICWMAWDRTDSGNTDIYARCIDFASGQWGEQIRLTTTPSIDEMPSVVHDLWDNGVIYQSDLAGAFGIYYIQRTHEGQWQSPWLSLSSSEDLLDPIYAPMISDVVEPGIFFHSDSSAQFFSGFGWEYL